MKNIIITGADGFIGSETCKYFLEQKKHVTAIGHRDKSKINSDSNFTYFKCDISIKNCLARFLPHGVYDTLIHFAWEGSSGTKRTDYNLQMQNALNTVEIMKQAKNIGCKRFLCAGSIMEYEVEDIVHAQGMKPGMPYIYGMGKLIAHCMCKSVAADIGIELLWPMITNAYGIGEISPRFINTTLHKILNHEKLQFTAATQNYDFIYITDVAKAFYLIAENGIPFKEYMIGSGKAKPLKEFLLEIQKILCPEQKMFFGGVPYTGVGTPLERFDITSIRTDCGFNPSVSFVDGIKMTYDWMKMKQI